MNRVKKILLGIAGICAVAGFAPSAQASSLYKGEMTLGIGGGYASRNASGYADIFFQYTFVPHVRIAPEIGYVFRHNDKSALTISCDMQFPFRLTRGFNFYPLVGATFNSWNYDGGGNRNKFGGDFGMGFELYMTGNLKINLQGKYSLMSGVSGAFVGLGVGYVF